MNGEGPTMNFLLNLAQESRESFKIDKEPLSEDDAFDIVTVMINFHIPLQQAKYLTEYLRKLMKDYKSYTDVLRKIQIDIKGYQKYFVVYILAKNFKHIYSKMTEEEQSKFMVDLFDKLSLPTERAVDYIEFIGNISKEEVDQGLFPPWSLKKIIESDFDDNEKDLLTFIYGLT